MQPLRFATDTEMHYATNRTRFIPGAPFFLDNMYRTAQLPLIAPDHPDVIAEAGNYRFGVHEPISSLVLPIDWQLLEASNTYQAIIMRLKHSVICNKIAWDMLPRRRDKLHATLCGQISTNRDGRLSQHLRDPLTRISRFRYSIAGLFSGDRNHGRIYLKIYPEIREQTSALADIVRIFGRTMPKLVLIGIFNLTDHLDISEASELSAILDEFGDSWIAQVEADGLNILTSRDDLVLDAEYTDRIALR